MGSLIARGAALAVVLVLLSVMAIDATYGSVSAVAFITTMSFLNAQ